MKERNRVILLCGLVALSSIATVMVESLLIFDGDSSGSTQLFRGCMTLLLLIVVGILIIVLAKDKV